MLTRASANALDGAISDLSSQGTLEVVYSTKEEPRTDQGSEDWYAWITRQVRESRVALVLFTPASIHDPGCTGRRVRSTAPPWPTPPLTSARVRPRSMACA
jgi:hypothetical protein